MIAFRHATLLIEGGRYRGVALLRQRKKLISTIINERIQAAVTFHDGVHSGREELCSSHYRGKLEMQLAEVEGRVYNQVFLDLTKAYDTVDHPRLFQIWQRTGGWTKKAHAQGLVGRF
jgi:hypothetical protein